MKVLNELLVKRQGVDKEGQERIIDLHVKREDIETTMARTDDSTTLQVLAKEWTLVQYQLQAVWGFNLDSAYHKFWTVPKCECPVLDNEDAYPHVQYRCSCRVHGEIDGNK